MKRKPGSYYCTDDIMLVLYLAVNELALTALMHHSHTYHSHDMDMFIIAPRGFLIVINNIALSAMLATYIIYHVLMFISKINL